MRARRDGEFKQNHATTALPLTKNDNPTCCFVCGMRAIGLGIGEMRRSSDDPCYICKRCAVAIDDYKKIRRLDDYELKALDGGVEAVGEYIEEHGVTDLAFYDGLMQKCW